MDNLIELVFCSKWLFAIKNANMLVFVTPHQFIEGICKRLVRKVRADAKGISFIKGMVVKKEGPSMISNLITK